MAYGKIVNPFDIGPKLDDGQWHSIAVTYDGNGSQSLYIDHSFVQTKSVYYNTQGDENWLGAMVEFGSYYNKFNGYLKDIAFYNYALTASQATTDSITE